MSIENPETLEEWLCRLKTHEDRIFVREKIDGEWESVALSTLTPERWAYHVARWIEEGALPVYVRKEPENGA